MYLGERFELNESSDLSVVELNGGYCICEVSN